MFIVLTLSRSDLVAGRGECRSFIVSSSAFKSSISLDLSIKSKEKLMFILVDLYMTSLFTPLKGSQKLNKFFRILQKPVIWNPKLNYCFILIRKIVLHCESFLILFEKIHFLGKQVDMTTFYQFKSTVVCTCCVFPCIDTMNDYTQPQT